MTKWKQVAHESSSVDNDIHKIQINLSHNGNDPSSAQNQETNKRRMYSSPMTQTAKIRQAFLKTEVHSQNHAIVQDCNPILMTSK